ncbi:hypothetical protein BN844_2771 [Pseudomonas sp. SHC52]|nr:hypothetical protein BN844_2771 [Pseudomonas sp. SHC52]
MRHVRKTCRRICAKVEYTPGSGPLGYRRESGYQSGTGQREAGKATEYPADAKDHSDRCLAGTPQRHSNTASLGADAQTNLTEM